MFDVRYLLGIADIVQFTTWHFVIELILMQIMQVITRSCVNHVETIDAWGLHSLCMFIAVMNIANIFVMRCKIPHLTVDYS